MPLASVRWLDRRRREPVERGAQGALHRFQRRHLVRLEIEERILDSAVAGHEPALGRVRAAAASAPSGERANLRGLLPSNSRRGGLCAHLATWRAPAPPASRRVRRRGRAAIVPAAAQGLGHPSVLSASWCLARRQASRVASAPPPPAFAMGGAAQVRQRSAARRLRRQAGQRMRVRPSAEATARTRGQAVTARCTQRCRTGDCKPQRIDRRWRGRGDAEAAARPIDGVHLGEPPPDIVGSGRGRRVGSGARPGRCRQSGCRGRGTPG